MCALSSRRNSVVPYEYSKKYQSKTYGFLQCMKCTRALGEVENELDCVCLKWSTTHKKDHSAVVEKELNSRTELIMGEWFGVEPFRAHLRALHVGEDCFDITPLSRKLPRSYHCFDIK